MPADLFLLSGDAVLNESMLTGESIPVSKVPAKDEDITNWKSKPENSKSFLYAGTRVVRVRGGFASDGLVRPALGLVTRTGMVNETVNPNVLTKMFIRLQHD